MGMIRFLTLGALMLWLAKPSCAICCVESLAATEQRETAAVRQLPIADDCCPSSEAERGIPSARTCCLLDEHSNDFTPHSPDRYEPGIEGVFQGLLLPVGPRRRVVQAPQPSPDLSTTYLTCSVLLI